MKQQFENNQWICEIDMRKSGFLGAGLALKITARNKETNEVIRKTYKTSLIELKSTLEKIKKDFGGKQ
jgi:hypothetical protein